MRSSLNLEDAVSGARKDEARQSVADWLDTRPRVPCQLWIRVNPDQAADDITATTTPEVAGVVVPKAEPALLARVSGLLAQREHELGVPEGAFRVLPLIETAAGLLAAADVATTPRVLRLGIGEADLAADLRLRPGPGRAELTPLRLQVVIASAAARVAAPVAPAATDFRDLGALRDSTWTLRQRRHLRPPASRRSPGRPRAIAGPGGHAGNDSIASAASSHPRCQLFG